MVEVVAALIQADDAALLCRRPQGKDQGGQWEFPGGKIEPGETGTQALARECREELGVELDVGEALAQVTHAYPGKTVHLTLYAARIRRGEPRSLEHSDMRWVPLAELADYELCPADARLLKGLEGRLSLAAHIKPGGR